ncbi:MAG: YciI family protein [Planctomycetota bacterium]
MAKFTLKFMLALHDDPRGFDDLSPEEMQQIVRRYTEWAGKLAEEGRMAGGEKLSDDGGKVIRRDGGEAVVKDGPYSETKEVFAGFFLIHANSYEDAVEVSRTCPHLEYGGTIEIRAVDLQ